MKKILTGFAIILIAGFATPIVFADDNQTAKFTVEKMTCATCPIAVRKAMERVDGVTDVKVDLDSKTATVIFDASKADPEAIAAASTDVGFPATVQGDHQ